MVLKYDILSVKTLYEHITEADYLATIQKPLISISSAIRHGDMNFPSRKRKSFAKTIGLLPGKI